MDMYEQSFNCHLLSTAIFTQTNYTSVISRQKVNQLELKTIRNKTKACFTWAVLTFEGMEL